MKKIRKLNGTVTGLAEYLNADGNGSDWNGFRDHNQGTSYIELMEALVDVQHRLCGYCEIALTEIDRQIEHVIPRSDAQYGEARELDIANMIACCKGGTASAHAPSEKSRDENRYLKPVRDNMSCGQAKEDRNEPEFVDPHALPAVPSVVKVMVNGRIEVDEKVCRSEGISAIRVCRTIEILNLDARRLRSAREKQWSTLEQETNEIEDPIDPKLMHAWIRAVLMPDDKGRLAPFFTTNRSYFGSLAESVLAETPQAWI